MHLSARMFVHLRRNMFCRSHSGQHPQFAKPMSLVVLRSETLLWLAPRFHLGHTKASLTFCPKSKYPMPRALLSFRILG